MSTGDGPRLFGVAPLWLVEDTTTLPLLSANGNPDMLLLEGITDDIDGGMDALDVILVDWLFINDVLFGGVSGSVDSVEVGAPGVAGPETELVLPKAPLKNKKRN